MINHWILVSDPEVYSFQQLTKDHITSYKYVTNAMAVKHLHIIKPFDMVLFVHGGNEKKFIGLAEIISEARQIENQPDPKKLCFDLKAMRRLFYPFSYYELEMSKDIKLPDFFEIPELGFYPVNLETWNKLLHLAKEKLL